MEIIQETSVSEWLMNEIRVNLGKKAREHIHLSDLLSPRKAYFQRINPKYATDKEIMYWTTGKGHEDALLYVSGYEHGEVAEWNGIYYTPDIFQSMPIEIKTRRRQLAKKGEEAQTYKHYLKQLKGYCAVTNKQRGWLWIWCLVSRDGDSGKTKPELVCYTVDFTKEELEEERGRLIKTKEMLEEALRIENQTGLPLCESWMCGKTLKIMEQKPICIECDREFEGSWGIKKHLTSKKGIGHNVREAIYRYEYEKECKYFDDCKPEVKYAKGSL